jgi:hypothetical protein
MIHTLSLDADLDLDALKKEFRKKLMTGGAVIRIPADISEPEIERIFLKVEEKIGDSAPKKNSIVEEVLKELAKHPSTSESVIRRIALYEDLPSIKRELAKRASK